MEELDQRVLELVTEKTHLEGDTLRTLQQVQYESNNVNTSTLHVHVHVHLNVG